jgi:hypothetical protein
VRRMRVLSVRACSANPSSESSSPPGPRSPVACVAVKVSQSPARIGHSLRTTYHRLPSILRGAPTGRQRVCADLGLRSHRSVSPTLLFPMNAPPLPPLTLPIAHDERPWRCGAPPTDDGHLAGIHAPSRRAMHGRSGCGAASALSYRLSARPALRILLPAVPSRSQHTVRGKRQWRCTTRKQQRTRTTACPSRT